MKKGYVYILSSYSKTLYIGVTSNLIQRIFQHKSKLVDGFTEKYNCNNLVYFEVHEDINAAILREKQMKKWKREWKINLIEEKNIEWKDLYESIL